MSSAVQIHVQAGVQAEVYHCKADLAVIGGAMGSGKSYAIILEILKCCEDSKFHCAVFRRKKKSLLATGGLWEELICVCQQYRIPIKTRVDFLKITFYSGASVSFMHGNYKKLVNFEDDLKGTQLSAIYIDEGDQFTSEEIRFMTTRMRGKSDIKPYMRITCNPCEGWIRYLVESYLDEDEYPIMNLRGKIKYLYMDNDNIILENSIDRFRINHGLTEDQIETIRTFTFIPGTVNENKALLKVQPDYIKNLYNLDEYKRNRFLYGCWKIIPKNAMFKNADFLHYAGYPKDVYDTFVTIDTAIKYGSHNDYTVASLWGVCDNNKGLYLLDMVRGHWPFAVARDTIMDFLIERNPDYCYIEDVTSGSILLQYLRNVFSGKETIIKGIRRSNQNGKNMRAMRAQANLAFVNTYVPDDLPKISSKFLKEVCSYSCENEHEHDDISDTWFDAVDIAARKFKRIKSSSDKKSRFGYQDESAKNQDLDISQKFEVLQSGLRRFR